MGYKWNFGDGTVGIGKTPSHVFKKPGSHRVWLTVTDSSGAKSTTSHLVTVLDRPPTASFTVPTTGKAGKPVTFVGKGTDPDEAIRSYAWNFGDGKTASGPRVSHTFARRGTYKVTLKVTDASRVSKSVTHSVTIH